MELTKSEQIRSGLQKSFQSGSSAKASIVCYGCKVIHAGELVIDPIEANIVLFIFHRFINSGSLEKISDISARMDIVSPTGRATWSRETISKLQKYLGKVILQKAFVADSLSHKQIKIQVNKISMRLLATTNQLLQNYFDNQGTHPLCNTSEKYSHYINQCYK